MHFYLFIHLLMSIIHIFFNQNFLYFYIRIYVKLYSLGNANKKSHGELFQWTNFHFQISPQITNNYTEKVNIQEVNKLMLLLL